MHHSSPRPIYNPTSQPTFFYSPGSLNWNISQAIHKLCPSTSSLPGLGGPHTGSKVKKVFLK